MTYYPKPISPPLVVQRLHLMAGKNTLSAFQIKQFEELIAESGYPYKFYQQPDHEIKINIDVHTITIHNADLIDETHFQSIEDDNILPKPIPLHPGGIVIYVSPGLIDYMQYGNLAPICGITACTQDHLEAQSLLPNPFAQDPTQMDGGRVRSTLADLVPDFQKRVKFPCDCRCAVQKDCSWCVQNNHKKYDQFPLVALNEVVVQLNDHCKWSRERIADWLDTLDLDLRFRKPEPKQVGQPAFLLKNQAKSAENGVYVAKLKGISVDFSIIDEATDFSLKLEKVKSSMASTDFSLKLEKVKSSMASMGSAANLSSLEICKILQSLGYPLPDNYDQHNDLI